VFLSANWHTNWHTAGGFGGCEIGKSRHRVGFFVLVVCEWLHCWEQFKLYSITQHWSALLSTSSASILYILYSSAQVLIAFLKLAYNLAYWLIYVLQ
jgi:hypothetical protein